VRREIGGQTGQATCSALNTNPLPASLIAARRRQHRRPFSCPCRRGSPAKDAGWRGCTAVGYCSAGGARSRGHLAGGRLSFLKVAREVAQLAGPKPSARLAPQTPTIPCCGAAGSVVSGHAAHGPGRLAPPARRNRPQPPSQVSEKFTLIAPRAVLGKKKILISAWP